MKETEIVGSVNVHEKPDYFMRQLGNINDHIRINKVVFVNANDYMYDQLQSKKGFVLNPEPINKRRLHGSLTRGIISNMRLALKELGHFEYFLVMSSRDFFLQESDRVGPDKENLYRIGDLDDEVNFGIGYIGRDYSKNDWHWPIFRRSKMYRYLMERKMLYASSPHEGLCIDRESCLRVVEFLDSPAEIQEDVFNFEWCMEEFAIQSKCANFKGFSNVGKGVWEVKDEHLHPNKLTRKMVR
jgi:hypothetical protein